MRWLVFSLALLLSSAQIVPRNNATISGVVVRSNTDQPIEDVEVRLERVADVVTDDSGKFEFRNLPPGRYRVSWDRPGYFHPVLGVSGAINEGVYTSRAYSRTRPGESQHGRSSPSLSGPGWGSMRGSGSIVVDLVENQSRTLVLPLVPGGVITGRVLDARGRPLVGGRVVPLQTAYESGQAILGADYAYASTNDRGEFRLFGLRPGHYYIRLETGRWGSRDLYRYSYFPSGSSARATPIVVHAGEESRGVNWNVGPDSTVRVFGTITIADPNFKYRERPPQDRRPGDSTLAATVYPPDTNFYVIERDSRGPLDPSTMQFQNSTSNEADRFAGKFELRGVRPGEYDVYALVRNADSNKAPDFYASRMTLTVGNQDVQNVAIVVGDVNSIEGRVVLMEGASAEAKSKLNVRVEPAVALHPYIDALVKWTEVRSDGTFTIPGMLEHRYQISVDGLSSDSFVADIRQGRTSVSEDGLVLNRGTGPIEVVLSGNSGSVQVTVKDAKQRSVDAATVTLVPVNESPRNSAKYKRTEFDPTKLQYPPMRGIPPGEYTVFAWDSIPDGAEMNAEFLREYQNRGVRVTVRPQQTATVELPLISTGN